MKIIKIIFAILFLLFAALQWNDPDPWLWIIIYSLSALLILADVIGKDVQKAYRVAIIIFAIYSLFYLPGVIEYLTSGAPEEIVGSMKAHKPYIEETREFGGLLIVTGVLLFLFYMNKKRIKFQKSNNK